MASVALFIPCFVDQCAPHVGAATVRVLERLGIDFDFPTDQTCCGQPFFNAGCTTDAARLAARWSRIFEPYDHVVCPSASCVSMVRNHSPHLVDAASEAHVPVLGKGNKPQIYELCEYLHDVLGIREWPGTFPYRVGVHIGCHGLRELGLARPSERMIERFDKVTALLRLLDAIEIVPLSRDECCGFGGTFAVTEPEMSVAMGRDRLADHVGAGAEVIVSTDWSCLMHLEGIQRRERQPVRFCHVAEVLAPAEEVQ